MIQFFESFGRDEFDFYGKGWDTKLYKNYRGWAPSKADLYKDYKFCICYENIKEIDGYVTEKILECFMYGIIPVYLGARNITDYVAENCFIDRRKFASDAELYEFMKAMDEETFNNYLDNIRKYLNGPQVKLFSIEQFVNIFINNVIKDHHETDA